MHDLWCGKGETLMKKQKTETLLSFKIFRVFFYAYMVILNIIWLIISLPYSLFTWKWQYNAERFSVHVFALHFKSAMKRKNAKIKEYESIQKS